MSPESSSENRPLSAREAATLRWLLTHALRSPEHQGLIHAVDDLRVRWTFEDGVSVAFEPKNSPLWAQNAVIARGRARSALGVALNVSVLAAGDSLLSLEVYDWHEDYTTYTLPQPEEMQPDSW